MCVCVCVCVMCVCRCVSVCYLHGQVSCLWAGDRHIHTDDDDVTDAGSDAEAQSP